MPTGIGIAGVLDEDGQPVGRTPQDDRHINNALRTPGILQGAVVETSTTAMTYRVYLGVIQMTRGGDDGAVLAPVPTTTLTVAATTGLPRRDLIYAKQNDPTKGDPNNQAFYGVVQGTPNSTPTDPALPAGALLLERIHVPANSTRTSSAYRINDRPYSIPYGGTLGILHRAVDTHNGLAARQDWQTWGNGEFFVPTNRLLEFSLLTCVSTDVGASRRGTMRFNINLDGNGAGNVITSFERAYDQDWTAHHMPHVQAVSAGRHTVSFGRARVNGDPFYQRYGVRASDGGRYPGIVLMVRDLGVAG
ncbi:hypothetical protein [Litorihabitans aurantiacus]|uniref:Uncharacterized protein n=1 Tax=Litorihabitans aurantiacus TaxID=1930061 RepID=A0AA37XI87_9MICO|nr:hypothetical protein [Litorihabitans aurantiacus]GMA33502.1 hypothetical protein GCM10025875_34940 [Litorihabitans aurantiacus]GMA33593.1 hypothetical protein GCM10025875_35850 [Litorihabitans aurantiacus]